MSKKPIRQFETWPAAARARRWWCLALALTAAGSAWACAVSLHGPRPAAAVSAEGSWWWFTDDAFHAPSPAEEEWLLGFAARERGGEADEPEVEIEKPSETNIYCPCDVSIRFHPGRNPRDPSRPVPINLQTVKVLAEKFVGPFHVTSDLTHRMEPFSDSGFSKARVAVPAGKYRVSIELRDQLGRIGRNQADFVVENR
jgi:hypothetical protein